MERVAIFIASARPERRIPQTARAFPNLQKLCSAPILPQALYGLAFGSGFFCLDLSFEVFSAQRLISWKVVGSRKTSGL